MKSIFYLPQCTSTNDEIEGFFTHTTSSVLALYTFCQTKGRGQYGNSWESSEHLNISYSIAIPEDQIHLQDFLFNFHTAVVLRDFLANLTKTRVEIKWPNDLIIKNKKVSGLLIERKTIGNKKYFVVGIGLNVLQKNFLHLPKAGSLLTQTEMSFDLTPLALKLHDYLITHLTQPIPPEKVGSNLNDHLYQKNRISVFAIQGIRQNGIIKEVDENGFLWVDLEKDGLQKFFHKQIEMLY